VATPLSAVSIGIGEAIAEAIALLLGTGAAAGRSPTVKLNFSDLVFSLAGMPRGSDQFKIMQEGFLIGYDQLVGGVESLKEDIKNKILQSSKTDEGNSGSKKKEKSKSVDDVLEDAEPGRKTKGKAKQWEKEGGYDEALKDFEDLGVKDVKDIPGGKTGKLPDGRKINVRNKSSDGRPTLEIQDPKGSIKIRYK